MKYVITFDDDRFDDLSPDEALDSMRLLLQYGTLDLAERSVRDLTLDFVAETTQRS